MRLPQKQKGWRYGCSVYVCVCVYIYVYVFIYLFSPPSLITGFDLRVLCLLGRCSTT
jgi:hypothetical protein